jgi:hypothetical protein
VTDNRDELHLDPDIFSYTFYQFVKKHHPGYLAQLMMKCYMALLVQSLVIYVKVIEVVDKSTPIYRGDPSINCTRLVCCFLMHYMQQPEVDKGIRMI